MKSLLEAGVHFGHRTRRWHPRMKQYIFTERNGIHIIDLQQTMGKLEEAYNFVRDMVAEGERCRMPYVNVRWLGGTLTNFRTIRTRIDYLQKLEERQANGDLEKLP